MKRNWFFTTALCGLMLLSSCAGNDQASAVYAAEGAYAAAAHVASQYEAGTFGAPDPAIVAKIKSYDQVAYDDLKVLRTGAQAGTTLDSAAVLAAQSAIDALAGYLKDQGIAATSGSLRHPAPARVSTTGGILASSPHEFSYRGFP